MNILIICGRDLKNKKIPPCAGLFINLKLLSHEVFYY